MSRVIIEGPDGAGKTTLGLQLAQDLRLDYLRGRSRGLMVEATWAALEAKTPSVLDRSYLTDVHYSFIYRRTPGSSRLDVYQYCLHVARHCALFVIASRKDYTSTILQALALRYIADSPWMNPDFNVLVQVEGAEQSWSKYELDRLKLLYRDRAKLIDEFPEGGAGCIYPRLEGKEAAFRGAPGCEVMVVGSANKPGRDDLVTAVAMACELSPWTTHFTNYRGADQETMIEKLQPRAVLDLSKASRRTPFEELVTRCKDHLESCSVRPKVLEPGWEVLTEDPWERKGK